VRLSNLKALDGSLGSKKRWRKSNRVESLGYVLRQSRRNVSNEMSRERGNRESLRAYRRSNTIERVDCFERYLRGSSSLKLVDRLVRRDRVRGSSSTRGATESLEGRRHVEERRYVGPREGF
jgi:hypothetical protein